MERPGRTLSLSVSDCRCTLCHASTFAAEERPFEFRESPCHSFAVVDSWTTDMDMDPLWSTTAKLDMLPSFTYIVNIIVNYLLIIFPWEASKRFKQCFVSGSCASVPRSLHNSRTGQVVKRDLETAAFLNGTWDQGLESTSWRYGDWWWLYRLTVYVLNLGVFSPWKRKMMENASGKQSRFTSES